MALLETQDIPRLTVTDVWLKAFDARKTGAREKCESISKPLLEQQIAPVVLHTRCNFGLHYNHGS